MRCSPRREYLVVGDRPGSKRVFYRYFRIGIGAEPTTVRYSFRRADAARYSGTDPKAHAAGVAERCRELLPEYEWRAIPA